MRTIGDRSRLFLLKGERRALRCCVSSEMRPQFRPPDSALYAADNVPFAVAVGSRVG
jgi:hypothetical protein